MTTVRVDIDTTLLACSSNSASTDTIVISLQRKNSREHIHSDSVTSRWTICGKVKVYMVTLKYIVYINDQSSKPLVNSIAEAKMYAVSNIKYKPVLRIECYSWPTKIGEWIYDYQAEVWLEQVIVNNT